MMMPALASLGSPLAMSAVLTVFLAGSALGQSASSERPLWSFIQQADRGSFDGTMLTFDGVSPKSIAFTDRPLRRVRLIATKTLIDPIWSESADSFADDPPNAILVYTVNGKVAEAVVEISKPELNGDILTFQVRLLEGTVPKTFSEPVMMIDYIANSGDNSVSILP